MLWKKALFRATMKTTYNLQWQTASTARAEGRQLQTMGSQEVFEDETALEQTCGGFGLLCSAGGCAAGRVLCGGRHLRPKQQLCAQLLLSAGRVDASGEKLCRKKASAVNKDVHPVLKLRS